ncbi:SDR family NAD(P)-dependent oxidoreductase, partial [Klebsiella pneumoniae]|nr:SDR family NAD(P)-dependent oxidoreductase [Klebsiella pneumoniae]
MHNNDVSRFSPSSPDALKNKIILITGTGDGIGREAALTYARYGAELILTGRTESKLQAVRDEITQRY